MHTYTHTFTCNTHTNTQVHATPTKSHTHTHTHTGAPHTATQKTNTQRYTQANPLKNKQSVSIMQVSMKLFLETVVCQPHRASKKLVNV